MYRAALAGLGLLATVLACILVLEYQRGDTENDPLPVASRPSPSALPDGTSAPRPPQPTRAWAETALARPLFSPTRRPPAGAPPVAAPLPRLSGVLVTEAAKTVIFAAADGERPIVAHEGSVIGSFQVREITAGQVTVAGPDGVRVLRPAFDPSDRAATASAQATPAVPAGPPAAPLDGKGSLLDQLLRRGTPDIGVPGLPRPPDAAAAPPPGRPPGLPLGAPPAPDSGRPGSGLSTLPGSAAGARP